MEATYQEAANDVRTTDRPGLFDRAICVLVECACLGTARKVSTGAIDTKGADPTMVRVSKHILESKRLDKIRSLQGEVRRYVGARSTPSMMFRSGVYLLALDLLPEVDEYLNKSTEDLAALVEDFIKEYEDAKKAAEEKLGPLFRATDYPDANVVRGAFSLRWQYLAVDAPRKLGDVSKAILEREREKAARTWNDALGEATTVLRVSMKELVDHMVEKLQPGEDGKKKIFRDSMVGNLREFLRTFGARNISDDQELAALAKQAELLLAGVDAETLREGPTTRDRVREGMEKIKQTLDTLVVNAPTGRRYSDTDE